MKAKRFELIENIMKKKRKRTTVITKKKATTLSVGLVKEASSCLSSGHTTFLVKFNCLAQGRRDFIGRRQALELGRK